MLFAKPFQPCSHSWTLCLRLHKCNYRVNIMGRAGLFRTKPKLSAEVLIRVATLLGFARHSTTRLMTISCIVVRP
jgi:hypothetical protein